MLYERYRFFLEIVKYSSITKAAEHMIISQSALSKYLRRLEESLGTPLFDRSVLPLKLTQAGEIFYRHVTQSIAMENVCQEQLHQLSNNTTETLRIGFGFWRSSCILPQILPVFKSKYPFIQIEVEEDYSDRTTEMLMSGRLDLCVVGAAHRYPTMNSILLKNELILLMGNNTNPLVKEMSLQSPTKSGFVHIDLDKFERERFVLASGKQGFSRTIREFCEKNNFHPGDVTTIDNLHTNMYMVSYGDYFSFLPEIALYTLRVPDNISFFTFGNPILTYPISLIYDPNRPLSNSARLFIEAVQQLYSNIFI